MPDPSNGQLYWAHPLVRDWFLGRFGTPTEPQVEGWPHILLGRTTFISAPTGSGKTFAAFLACIDRLVKKALAGNLADCTEVLYVSPLKALSNDIHKNLEVPLTEIVALAEKRGMPIKEIRTAVRTGDTLAHERQMMLKRPPHILVTTPESLYILLTAEKSRAMLRHVDTVIVDEIHAVADDKRGAHLALSLERLEALLDRPPVRIGLSATVKPIEEIAHFLTGSGRPAPVIVNVGHRRQLDLFVEVPASPLGAVASNEIWDEVYDRIAELAQKHRSTLVFVNTRRLAERMAHHLGERLGQDLVAAHHGSLSRKLRLAAEKKLKAGELKVMAATASLELGIDIGTIDLVCQVESPRSIAVALQRVGRAGHWRGAVPEGRFFALTRDQLIECAALVRAIRQGDLDCTVIPDAPLDILAQQIVAACATGEWKEADLFALVRRAYPYRDLDRKTFEAVLEMLCEGFSGRTVQRGAYIYWDRVNGRLRGRRGSRLVAITCGGAIPETGDFTVVAEPDEKVVGTVDEDFAVESNRGDVFLLGTTSWMIKRVEPRASRVIVHDAHGAPPSVPFWRGEAPSRTAELSARVGELRQAVSDLTPKLSPDGYARGLAESTGAVAWLKDNCGLDDAGSEQIIQYIVEGRAVLSAVPTQNTIIAERFFDESGGMQLIIHAPFGGRINKAWGLALRKRFCQAFNLELQAAATDDGLNISLSDKHSFPLADVFHFLHPNSIDYVLEQTVLASPVFTTRFRWDAARALAVLRFAGGKKVPLQLQRMRTEDVLAAVFPDAAACQDNIDGPRTIPDHPLVKEVMKDALTEALDLPGLKQVLSDLSAGKMRLIAIDTPVPSPFCHEILNANPYAYLDDAPLEERRARAVELRRALPRSVVEEVGRLDPAAIAQVREEAWPDIRDPDELHDLLQTVIALPEDQPGTDRPSARITWERYFESLLSERRAAVFEHGDARFWVASEKARAFAVAFPEGRPISVGAQFLTAESTSHEPPGDKEGVLTTIVRGWMSYLGPTTVPELAGLLRLAPEDIERALLKLESGGFVLRGQFTGQERGREWCERRLLARIHRLTLGALRREIEPVSPAQFMRWLFDWHHVSPGTQLSGERGALEIVRQLQGFEAPANAWEPLILARRIRSYDPQVLDQLCLTGAIGWGRLSPHPALAPASTEQLTLVEDEGSGRRLQSKRRVQPTSVAPISFFLREQCDWLALRHRPVEERDLTGLSYAACQAYSVLRSRGASFFADIVRSTGLLKAEVESALWELVAAGVVTADGFDNLRALIDPRRRAGQGRGKYSRPRHSPGRWTLIHSEEPPDRHKGIEAMCWLLLRRYGIVFRDLLARETITPRWRELLIAYRRLEDRGEVRGGRFVSGFLGEQFALPVAVEALRAVRKREPTGQVVTISAADPLNLSGIIVPGERIPAVSTRFVRFCDGAAVGTDEVKPAPHTA